ncbi:unnamed protein product [Blepharisma stoltei]|uniref:Calmodulin n=1 Tax=Blepharisma stoltei TaxID=1481888 RepID=A0AAU9K1Y1_9CILI|nr:unnamed protein product [Blepharisma stoltei]
MSVSEFDEVNQGLRELKEVFDYFDKDRSGEIDSSELVQLLSCLGENPVEEEIQDMIDAMDEDKNGKISWAEFSKEFIRRRGKRDIDKEIQTLFGMFDRDETQIITKEGVYYMMNNVLKEKITMQDADDMIRVVSGSRGYITFEEFKKLMKDGI